MKRNPISRSVNRVTRRVQRKLDDLVFLIVVGAAVIIGIYLFLTDIVPSVMADISGDPQRGFGVLVGLLIVAGVAVLLCMVPRWWSKHRLQKKYHNAQLEKVDKMTGEEFEEFLAAKFSELGYKVETTPRNNDYGGDLVISKNGVRTVVQAKRYTKNVDNSAVQEATAAMKVYNSKKGMVVTSSFYTKNAKHLAEVNGITLWDRSDLVREFRLSNYD